MLLLLLLLQDVDALRADDVEVRQAAVQRWRALGKTAVPRLRELLREERDPEVRGRLADVLDSLLTVRAELHVANPRLRVGERPEWRASIVNERRTPILLARMRGGSGGYLQLQLMDVEIVHPDGTVFSGRDRAYDFTGRLEGVEESLFVELPPGGAFDPLADARSVWWFERWAPERPGRHRFRFVYDTSPRRWQAWEEFAPRELRPSEEGVLKQAVQDWDPRTAALFARLHHERVVSPWVDLDVE